MVFIQSLSLEKIYFYESRPLNVFWIRTIGSRTTDYIICMFFLDLKREKLQFRKSIQMKYNPKFIFYNNAKLYGPRDLLLEIVDKNASYQIK